MFKTRRADNELFFKFLLTSPKLPVFGLFESPIRSQRLVLSIRLPRINRGGDICRAVGFGVANVGNRHLRTAHRHKRKHKRNHASTSLCDADDSMRPNLRRQVFEELPEKYAPDSPDWSNDVDVSQFSCPLMQMIENGPIFLAYFFVFQTKNCNRERKETAVLPVLICWQLGFQVS